MTTTTTTITADNNASYTATPEGWTWGARTAEGRYMVRADGAKILVVKDRAHGLPIFWWNAREIENHLNGRNVNA